MAGSSSKLTGKQEDAIVALLGQRSMEEATRVAGVGARTLYRWVGEAEFDAAYRKAKRTAFRQSVARLQQASSAAVSTLLKVMVDPDGGRFIGRLATYYTQSPVILIGSAK
jgi:hypothetical protein